MYICDSCIILYLTFSLLCLLPSSNTERGYVANAGLCRCSVREHRRRAGDQGLYLVGAWTGQRLPAPEGAPQSRVHLRRGYISQASGITARPRNAAIRGSRCNRPIFCFADSRWWVAYCPPKTSRCRCRRCSVTCWSCASREYSREMFEPFPNLSHPTGWKLRESRRIDLRFFTSES